MRKLFLIILSMLVVSAMARADAISIFNTGVSASNMLLPTGSIDPHYQIASAPMSGGGPAAFVGNLDGLPYLANGPNSQWISPTTMTADTLPAGLYTYTTTFTLPVGFTNASLSGQWASDNEASMKMNGGPVISMTPNSTASFQSFTSFSINSGFVAGLNTLTFDVTNDQAGPTALRVEIGGSFVEAVPETGNLLAPVGASLLILGGLARRLRKQYADRPARKRLPALFS